MPDSICSARRSSPFFRTYIDIPSNLPLGKQTTLLGRVDIKFGSRKMVVFAVRECGLEAKKIRECVHSLNLPHNFALLRQCECSQPTIWMRHQR